MLEILILIHNKRFLMNKIKLLLFKKMKRYRPSLVKSVSVSIYQPPLHE